MNQGSLVTLAPSPSRDLVVRNPRARELVRRIALMFSMLISGGNLILPRAGLITGLVGAAIMLVSPAKLLRRELALIWAVLALTAVVALIGGGEIRPGPFLTRYANFFGALLLLAAYLDERKGTLERDLLPIFVFFGFQAVGTPVAALLVPQFFLQFVVDDAVYHSLLFIFTYHENIVTFIKRPDGFFFEPGVFQIYLNLYLYVALFRVRQGKHIAFALAAVLATQSTTGVVIAALLCMFYALDRMRRSGASEQVILLVMAPLVLIPLALVVGLNLEEKLFGAFSGSRDARQFDLMTGLRVVAEHPFAGIGFDHQRYLEISARFGNFEDARAFEAFYGRTNSNGIMTMMYMVGIPLFLIYLAGLLRQRFFPHRLLVFGLLVLSFMTEALIATPFFLMIIFSGLLVVESRVRQRGSISPSRSPHIRAR